MTFGVLSICLAFFLAICEKWSDWKKNDREATGSGNVQNRRWRMICRFGIIGAMATVGVYSIQKERDDNLREQHDTKSIDSLKDISRTLKKSVDSSDRKLTSIDSILLKVYNLQINDSSGKITVVNNNYSGTSTVICPIDITLAQKPNYQTQVLCNGDVIPSQYKIDSGSRKFTVPYMRGKDYAGSMTMGGINLMHVKFEKSTGTFDIDGSIEGGTLDNLTFTFTANLPIKN